MATHGGARAGAGRKSILEEGRIADLISTSIDVTHRFLKDNSIPIEKRAEIASRVASKRIPSDINLGGQADNPLSVVQLVTMNDNSKPDASSVKGD